eukprot:5753539-Lingulodinium_polyedra.AAC.1
MPVIFMRVRRARRLALSSWAAAGAGAANRAGTRLPLYWRLAGILYWRLAGIGHHGTKCQLLSN